MVQWTGRLPAGKVYDLPAIALDIHPTFVSAAGGSLSPDWKLDGVDLIPHLTGEDPAPPHDTLYWRFGEQWAIRQGDWKLVKGRAATTAALYNLAEDIGEKTDLATAQAGKTQELQQAYDAWNAELIAPRWTRQANARRRRRARAGGAGE